MPTELPKFSTRQFMRMIGTTGYENPDYTRKLLAKISQYEDAMATGNFRRAKALMGPDVIEMDLHPRYKEIKEPPGEKMPLKELKKLYKKENIVGSSIGYTRALYTKPALFLKAYLKHLSRAAGESLNSPLLDLLGPIQTSEAMRKVRGTNKRKYLVDESL